MRPVCARSANLGSAARTVVVAGAQRDQAIDRAIVDRHRGAGRDLQHHALRGDLQFAVPREDVGTAEADVGIPRRADAFHPGLQQGGREFAGGEDEFHGRSDSVAGIATSAGRPHIGRMPTLLILMIVGAMGFAFWSASRAAAERAIRLGGEACRAAGVQLIDHTVHASGLRLRRGENGWLGFERSFRFEYSYDGTDRHIARLVLHGDRLVSFTGPVMPPAVVPVGRPPIDDHPPTH
jgi:hypothetical protein